MASAAGSTIDTMSSLTVAVGRYSVAGAPAQPAASTSGSSAPTRRQTTGAPERSSERITDERKHPAPVEDAEPGDERDRANRLGRRRRIVAGTKQERAGGHEPLEGKGVHPGQRETAEFQPPRRVVDVLLGV